MVKCKDCGLLALRKTHGAEFLEPDRDYREGGHLYGGLGDATSGPLCFVMAHDLRAEVMDLRDTPEQPRSLTIISRDRDCTRFTTWMQGFTPKEHLAMIHEQELRRLQAEQRAADRRWQKRQKRSDRRWQERQKLNDRIWGIGIGVAAFVAGFLFNKYFNPPPAPPSPPTAAAPVP